MNDHPDYKCFDGPEGAAAAVPLSEGRLAQVHRHEMRLQPSLLHPRPTTALHHCLASDAKVGVFKLSKRILQTDLPKSEEIKP